MKCICSRKRFKLGMEVNKIEQDKDINIEREREGMDER